MKKTLTDTVLHFFDSESKYRKFAVPLNGKAISLKALMHSLF